MKQSRINQLKPLKIAVDAVRNARRNERDSFLALINTRPDDEKYQSTNQSWQSWKGAIYDAVKVFRRVWKSTYGFDYFPDCGCESRIPREEFDWLNAR